MRQWVFERESLGFGDMVEGVAVFLTVFDYDDSLLLDGVCGRFVGVLRVIDASGAGAE